MILSNFRIHQIPFSRNGILILSKILQFGLLFHACHCRCPFEARCRIKKSDQMIEIVRYHGNTGTKSNWNDHVSKRKFSLPKIAVLFSKKCESFVWNIELINDILHCYLQITLKIPYNGTIVEPNYRSQNHNVCEIELNWPFLQRKWKEKLLNSNLVTMENECEKKPTKKNSLEIVLKWKWIKEFIK